MSQTNSHRSPLLHSPASTYSNHNKPTKIILVATLIALVILIIINLPNLDPSQKIQDSNLIESAVIRNGSRGHKSSAILIKDPKQIQKVVVKIPKPDKRSPFMQRFELNGPQITYKGPTQKWTQLVGYKQIPYNETYKLKMVVVFSANQHIMLGITNQERIMSQSSFFNQDTYAYYGNNGCLWVEGQLLLKDGIGYSEKEVVELDVQLWEGLIQWKVNGVVRGQVYSQKLKKNDIKFVPYLEMFEANDYVRMIQ